MGWNKFKKWVTKPSTIGGAIAGPLGYYAGYNIEEQERASDAEKEAAQQAQDVQLQMFREGMEATAPWREAGEKALGTLEERIAAGPGEYTKSPGYQFRLGQGLEQIQSGRGNVRSGATEKALQRYAQDYATSDYDNFLQRYYQSLTPYQSLSGLGQTTATQGAQMGQQTASNVGQSILREGQARAGGYTNQLNYLNQLMGQGVGIAAATYGGPGWGA